MDEATSRRGNDYVTVREWARGRADDERQTQRDRDVALGLSEERIMAALNTHIRISQDAHKAQDDRIVKLADGIDHIDSALDQQRGARNILLFLVGTSVVQVIALVITILVVH